MHIHTSRYVFYEASQANVYLLKDKKALCSSRDLLLRNNKNKHVDVGNLRRDLLFDNNKNKYGDVGWSGKGLFRNK